MGRGRKTLSQLKANDEIVGAVKRFDDAWRLLYNTLDKHAELRHTARLMEASLVEAVKLLAKDVPDAFIFEAAKKRKGDVA